MGIFIQKYHCHAFLGFKLDHFGIFHTFLQKKKNLYKNDHLHKTSEHKINYTLNTVLKINV